MPAPPLRMAAAGLDLSGRFFRSGTVAASPSAATETTICTLTITDELAFTRGVILFGWCAFTVGGSGVSAQLKLRQTSTAGTTIKDSGATTIAAAALGERSILGLDANAVLPNQVYVLTLTVASAVAASTVSAAELFALVV